MPFVVTYIDNYAAPGEGGYSTGGSFTSFEEAVAHCKRVVDGFLQDNFKPGVSAGDLWSVYARYGDDPNVRDGQGNHFSGWDYARARCTMICRGDSHEH